MQVRKRVVATVAGFFTALLMSGATLGDERPKTDVMGTDAAAQMFDSRSRYDQSGDIPRWCIHHFRAYTRFCLHPLGA